MASQHDQECPLLKMNQCVRFKDHYGRKMGEETLTHTRT